MHRADTIREEEAVRKDAEVASEEDPQGWVMTEDISEKPKKLL